ncbi:hypothetical protein MMC25_002607 [Agyrium rufum]|nr:hypothetical protein [Agyrium rufum]
MPSKYEEAMASSASEKAQEENNNALPEYSASPANGPSAQSPFNFPSDDAPPAFTASPSSSSASPSTSSPRTFQRPIAIPQASADKTAPFLEAYARPLLQHGVTPEAWRGFVSTMSAFLAAKVSEQAVAHAADIGRHVTDVPKRFSQGTVSHAKSIGNHIRTRSKNGNYLGAAVGAIGGSIALPVGTVFRGVGAVVSLPFAAVNGIAQKPATPRERAAAYAAAANEKWLGVRGLHAHLVDTEDLASMLGVSPTGLVDLAHASNDRTAAGQLDALSEHVEKLEVFSESTLDLGAESLWLLVWQDDGAAIPPSPTNASATHSKGRGRGHGKDDKM